MPDTWDAFLSYASEDRDDASLLAQFLIGLGARIWFDTTELRVGDSLRERVDTGLAHSRFGIVLLSPAFFQKHYPVRELNGLAQREINGEQVILPIWKGVTAEDVRAFSPPLADRVALQWDSGLAPIVLAIFSKLCPAQHADFSALTKQILDFPEIRSGQDFFSLMGGAHATQHFSDAITTQAEAALIGGILTQASEVADFAEDVDQVERLKWQLRITSEIQALNDGGWQMYGARTSRPLAGEEPSSEWTIAQLAVVRSPVKAVALLPDGHLLIGRDSRANQSSA